MTKLKTTVSALALLAMTAGHGYANTYEVPLTRVGGNYALNVNVNGTPMKMLLDTGADDVCIPYSTAVQLVSQGKMLASEIGGETAISTAGSDTKMTHVTLREVTVYGNNGYGWQVTNVSATIGCQIPLLGQEYLRSADSYSIDNTHNILMLNTPSPSYTAPTALVPGLGSKPPPSSSPPSYTPPPDDPAMQSFSDGQRDRRAWEAWFTTLTDGPYKQGAEYWASVRSTKEASLGCNPISSSDYANSQIRVSGCTEAKHRLDTSDHRRASDASYKAGWNSIPG